MSAADLLGPARLPPPVVARPHDGPTVTTHPNVMWGTDATATVTLGDNFGGMAVGVATGLTMRHDHGSQYMNDDFQAEVRFLCIVSSSAFVRQPEGNACVERFFRTLKE